LAAVSFSKVTEADWLALLSFDSGVTESEEILPQKEKKSRTSFSDVCEEMFLTWTVFDMVAFGGLWWFVGVVLLVVEVCWRMF